MSPLILRDTAEGTLKFPLADASLTLGRAADCGIRIDDRSLSAHHCRFDPVPGGWKVVDLTSRNGTFVNDVLVAQKRLDDGDRLRAGRVLFRYVVDDETVDEEAAVEALVDRVHRRAGHAGLRRAAGAFASASEKVGLPGLLPGADEVAGAARLRSVAAAMVSERSERALYDQIVDALIDLTGAERGFLILAETEGGTERRVVAARNFDREAVRDAMAKVSKTVERQAFDTGNPVVVTDATMDERFSGTQSVLNLRLRSILCVAVRGREGPIGTIYLDNRFERGVFEERQLPLIRAFADQAALAVENARLHEENERRLADLERANAEVEELNRILSDRVAKASVELQEIKEHVLRERAEAPLKYSYANIVGSSRPMQDLFHLLDKVTDSDVPVLIQGESGTGKELVARAIHFNGPRADLPFVSENCAAIPETLLESELFGYARGAFTGATADRTDLLLLQDAQELLLHLHRHVADLVEEDRPARRVLEQALPVGGKRTILVDVRVLSASNQDLRRLVAEGRFREDLYYRLNVITVELPPLRERAEDVPLLVDRFLDEIAGAGNVPRKAITEDARMLLQRYAWPGNVRELRNEIQKAHALSDKVILPMVLSEPIRRALSTPTPVPALGEKPLKELVREVVDDLERRAILEALRRTRGRKAQAARMLGVSRPTLDAKIDLLHIPVPKGAE